MHSSISPSYFSLDSACIDALRSFTPNTPSAPLNSLSVMHQQQHSAILSINSLPPSHPSTSSILQGPMTYSWRKGTPSRLQWNTRVLNWLSLIKKKWSSEWLLRNDEESQFASTVSHLLGGLSVQIICKLLEQLLSRLYVHEDQFSFHIFKNKKLLLFCF